MVKRAALYLRVSTGTQTVENQERELRAVAAQAGWKIVKVYADVAVSGGKARHDRPAFQQMCDDAARRRFDLVAAWSVDRISRNLQDLLAFVAELRELKIDLFLLAQALDTTTPAGRAMFAMCGVFSELERSVIRERVLSGLNRARAEGKRLGRPRLDPAIESRSSRAVSEKSMGIKKMAAYFGVGVGTVQRIRRELQSSPATPALITADHVPVSSTVARI